MSAVSEQDNKLKQTMELARAELLKSKSWSSEFSAQDVEGLASAAMSTVDAVTKPGMVTVRISGGERGTQNVRGAIDVAGLEGNMVGGEKINEQFVKAFQKELGSGTKPVQLATYGLALTERNTFKVSLTAK